MKIYKYLHKVLMFLKIILKLIENIENTMRQYSKVFAKESRHLSQKLRQYKKL